MQIVIDIPKEMYQTIKETSRFISGRRSGKRIDYTLFNAVYNGIPLPEGHGRMIDADSLIKAIEEKAKRLSNTDTINGLCGAVALIFDEQSIIEANKEE